MAAIATREQERKALEQIKKIVEALGPDSYIGTAFDGVFGVAEYNINNDAACSLRDRAAIFAREQALTETAEKIKKLEAQLADTTALYNATDWNYIRFNVCGWSYEMQDGNLRLYR